MNLEELIEEDDPSVFEIRRCRREIRQQTGLFVPRSLSEVEQWFEDNYDEISDVAIDKSPDEETNNNENESDNE